MFPVPGRPSRPPWSAGPSNRPFLTRWSRLCRSVKCRYFLSAVKFLLREGDSSRRETIILGIALAVAVLAAVGGSFVWIAVPLLVIAVLLFAWGLEPERTEAFVGRLPYGNYPLKVLAKLDLMLPGRELSEP
jgi:hypothetical protein